MMRFFRSSQCSFKRATEPGVVISSFRVHRIGNTRSFAIQLGVYWNP